MRINQGEGLERDSDAMIDQLRAIDNKRFAGGPLRQLDPKELGEVDPGNPRSHGLRGSLKLDIWSWTREEGSSS